MTSVSLDVRLSYPVFGPFGFDLLVYEFKLLSSFLGRALRRYCARIRKTMHEEGNLTSFLEDTNISSCRVYQGLRGDIFITPCGWDTVIMVNESSCSLYSIWFCHECFNTFFNIHFQYRFLSGTDTVLILSFALDIRVRENQPSSIPSHCPQCC